MIIVPYNQAFAKQWNDFCLQQPNAWFFHTTYWIEYCLNAQFNVPAFNQSFLVFDDHGLELYAIVPIIIEKRVDSFQMNFSGGAIPVPIIAEAYNEKTKKAIEQSIFSEYLRIAEQEGVQRIFIKQPNSYQNGSNLMDPILARQGYLDITTFTSVLDLRVSEEALLKGMTKGHRSAIHKGLKLDVIIKCFDKATISQDKFDEFKKAYFTAAGKSTRPDDTFQHLYELINLGYGMLFEAELYNQSQGFVFTIIYKSYAYYSMSCRTKTPTAIDSQIIQWAVILHLKSINCYFYELGEQYFTSTLITSIDSKLMDISKFKRGFGGTIIPQFSGEYFTSGEYLQKLWQERIQIYLSSESRGE